MARIINFFKATLVCLLFVARAMARVWKLGNNLLCMSATFPALSQLGRVPHFCEVGSDYDLLTWWPDFNSKAKPCACVFFFIAFQNESDCASCEFLCIGCLPLLRCWSMSVRMDWPPSPWHLFVSSSRVPSLSICCQAQLFDLGVGDQTQILSLA